MIEEVFQNDDTPQIWRTPKADSPAAVKSWRGERQSRQRNHLPSLEEILARQVDFPSLSLLLGLSNEGLPLVLDLVNPESGSFLIASDIGFDNTNLLHNLIAAALRGNQSEEIGLHLISPHLEDLRYFSQEKNFRIGCQPVDPEVPIVLEEMVNLVISRREDPEPDVCHIFGIDGLDLLWQSLDPASRLRLDWLIRNGPATGFWTFATLDTSHLFQVLTGTVDFFPSRIVGAVRNAGTARSLAGVDPGYLSELLPGQEFILITGAQADHLQMVQSIDLVDEWVSD